MAALYAWNHHGMSDKMTGEANTLDIKGGRIFFSGAGRSLIEEDEICLTSVGIDIGSSTTHLMFSHITLERLDTRYVVSNREVLYASDILLTPYTNCEDIDTDKLSAFIECEYKKSGILKQDVDTGALILTGVAVRRSNARAIGELFAAEAGKFVSVSAGDNLETVMSAHGSGAVNASKNDRHVLNVDIGGGTTKLAVCHNGEVEHLTAIEVGARLVVTDTKDKIIRLEEFGAHALGTDYDLGSNLPLSIRKELAETFADHIFEAIHGRLDKSLHRLDPLPKNTQYDAIVLSGGVSEYFYKNTSESFGDLGPLLAAALRSRFESLDIEILSGSGGIRATVVGASQYTVQVSGSTVYLDPLDAVPLKNIVTIKPKILLNEEISVSAVADEINKELKFYDLETTEQPVAIALPWSGSATYARLDALSRGLIQGVQSILAKGHPLIIVTDSDIGGLLGIHCRENNLTSNAIISIDGITLASFDFIDIGEVIRATGSVPVVIKSLVFPSETVASVSKEVA